MVTDPNYLGLILIRLWNTYCIWLYRSNADNYDPQANTDNNHVISMDTDSKLIILMRMQHKMMVLVFIMVVWIRKQLGQ